MDTSSERLQTGQIGGFPQYVEIFDGGSSNSSMPAIAHWRIKELRVTPCFFARASTFSINSGSKATE